MVTVQKWKNFLIKNSQGRGIRKTFLTKFVDITVSTSQNIERPSTIVKAMNPHILQHDSEIFSRPKPPLTRLFERDLSFPSSGGVGKEKPSL